MERFCVEAMMQSKDKPSSKVTMLWLREAKMLWYKWPRLGIRNGIMYRKFEAPDGLPYSWHLVAIGRTGEIPEKVVA